MLDSLSVRSGLKVFEPCAGDGVFADGLNARLPNLSIDLCELNPDAARLLEVKYGGSKKIKVFRADTLTSAHFQSLANAGGAYDRIIGNPPYGGWLDYDKRDYLKTLYPDLYVRETYGLFLYQCTRLLREGGILVFIIPDTFLNLHMHRKLREFLLTNSRIKEICLFPSSFFPGVNFGYSNLCIITLEKCGSRQESLTNRLKVITGLRSVDDLESLGSEPARHHKVFTFSQGEIYRNTDHALLLAEDNHISNLIKHKNTAVGDVAACVTGFYSGDDKKYLRPISREARNAGKYEPVDEERICADFLDVPDILDGISGRKNFVPIVKGGGVKFFKPDRWYMDWSTEAVAHYKRDKKARFQNPRYYFRRGVGVPMVSSSCVTAALIENRLFDQSIVGVFPMQEELIYYLLAFFNSPTCNKLIRAINPSANNSANYIKKIPFVYPSKSELDEIDKAVALILSDLRVGKGYDEAAGTKINRLIEGIFSSHTAPTSTTRE